MTGEKYLICHDCKNYVYVSKNGRLEPREHERNDIAKFIEDHEFECRGSMQVWDEAAIPPDNGNYKNYYGKGRRD